MITLLEENTREYLGDLRLVGECFMYNMIEETIDNIDFITIQNSYFAKDSIKTIRKHVRQ
jgi:hypothetical protein